MNLNAPDLCLGIVLFCLRALYTCIYLCLRFGDSLRVQNEESAFKRTSREHYSEKCGRERDDILVSSNSS